jgi:acyl-CoA dehydrogenase
VPDQTFLHWPFFDEHHRRFATELREWAAHEVHGLVDHADVDGTCRRLVRALGQAGWLRAAIPAAYGGLFPTFDVRSLCLARETLAYEDGLADFAFAAPTSSKAAISPASPVATRSLPSRSRSPRPGPTSRP